MHDSPRRPSVRPELRGFVLAVVLAGALAAAGCSERWMPSERRAYALAAEAVRATPGFPEGGEIAPITECRFFMLKNSGRVDVTVQGLPAGRNVYVVWVKRVARTWVVERTYLAADAPPAG